MEKTMLRKLAMLLLLACLPLTMMADDFKYIVHDGVQYQVYKKIVKERDGKEYYWANVVDFKKKGMHYEGDVVIPESFVIKDRLYRVDEVLGDGFSDSPNLTSVTVAARPSISINSSHFRRCPRLKRVTLAKAPRRINFDVVYRKEVSPDFEGIFIQDRDDFTYAKSLRNIKAKSLRVYFDTSGKSSGGNEKHKFFGTSVDTLFLYSSGRVSIQPSDEGARVNTLIVEEVEPHFDDWSVQVVNINAKHLVIGEKMKKIYDNMYKGNLDSLTIKGDIRDVSNGSFLNMSNIAYYDVGNNKELASMIEYSMYVDRNRRGLKEEAMIHLRKASELGNEEGSRQLALYQSNVADWEKMMSKSAQQGSSDARATLQAMEYCKRLREIYPSIAALAKAGKMDTTLMKEVRMMSEYNGISLNNQDHRKTNNTMKYSIPGYEDVYNKARDMLAYFFMCQELTRKYRDHYYGKTVSGSRYLYYLGEEYSTDRNAIANAHHFASRYSTIASQDFRPFFVNAAKQLTAKKEKFDAQNKEELLIVEQHNNEVDQLKREEALEHKRQTDPDYMPVPAISRVERGPHGRFFDTDRNYDDYDFYHFADGTKVEVHHRHRDGGLLLGLDFFYFEGFNNWEYNSAENAAKAGWIWKKHMKIRTIGLDNKELLYD